MSFCFIQLDIEHEEVIHYFPNLYQKTVKKIGILVDVVKVHISENND